MTCSVRSKPSDGFLWQCQRRVARATCNQSAPIRHGSSFQLSRLSLQEIMMFAYEIECREPAHKIENEYCFRDQSQTGACSARKPCSCFWRAALLKLVVLTRPSKLTNASSVGESIIGDTLLRVSECLAVLNASGETFLVPVKDRTANTLIDIIRDWVEPSTTVISDCWGACRNVGSQGYLHHTVKHSMHSIDPDTGAHTNTNEHVASSQGFPQAVHFFITTYHEFSHFPAISFSSIQPTKNHFPSTPSLITEISVSDASFARHHLAVPILRSLPTCLQRHGGRVWCVGCLNSILILRGARRKIWTGLRL